MMATRASVFLSLAAVLFAAIPASATYPGKNGRIVYPAAFQNSPTGTALWRLEPDLSEDVAFSTFPSSIALVNPRWSPSGSRIAVWQGLAVNPAAIHLSIAAAGGDTVGFIDLQGDVLDVAPGFVGNAGPTWSPDETKLAIALGTSPGGIYVVDIATKTLTEILPNASVNYIYDQPAWSPDGSRIAVRIHQLGVGTYGHRDDIGVFPAGGGSVENLTQNRNPDGSDGDAGCLVGGPSWRPDGIRIVYHEGKCDRPVIGVDDQPHPDDRSRIAAVDVPTATLIELAPSAHLEYPVYSPDGTQIVARGIPFNQNKLTFFPADGLTGPGVVYTVTPPSTSGPPDWQPVFDKLRASLAAAPSPLGQGDDVTLTLTVTNAGSDRVTNIVPPSSLTLGGANPAIVQQQSGPNPNVEFGLDGGVSRDVTYVYHSTGNGNLTFSTTVDGITSTLATLHSNTATVALKVLNKATLTTDTIVEAFEGRTLTYEGKGFDPDGGEIAILWNNVPIATQPAAATFKGTFQVPPYPPITVPDVIAGKPRCQARVRATQSDTTAYADVSAPSGEIVYYADGISYENGTPVSQQAWTFLCRGALLHDAGGHPLFAHDPFGGGDPGILLATNLNDLRSGRSATEKPPEGRVTRLFDPYGAFLVQACFEDHSTVNFVGANPPQLFIGEALVLDTGREKAGPISVAHAPISFVAGATYGLLSTNGFQFAPATPPANDHDSDGIENDIDGDIVHQGQQDFFTPMPQTFSSEFSNVNLGGNIVGGILQRDGVTLHFSGDAAGVTFRAHVMVGDEGRERRATIRVCRSAFRVGEGAKGTMSCGSLILHMLEGEAAIVLGVGADVIVPAGATVEVADVDSTHASVTSDPSSTVDATVVENGATTPVSPGTSVMRTVAPDHDGDGIADGADGCPDDPGKGAPGTCGCGNPDVDGDGDGTIDCEDGCPFDATKLTPGGSCGCNCCEAASKPKIALGKVLPPTGDDTLTVQATFTIGTVAIDPIADGLSFSIGDRTGVPIAITIPGGAYAKATKTGWKVNKKHTAWSFKQPKGTPGGTFAVTVKRKDATVTVKATGKGGAFVAEPPLSLTVRFNDGLPCGTSAFDVGKQACVLKSKGKAVSCK